MAEKSEENEQLKPLPDAKDRDSILQRKISGWRNKLIDLSKRNRLLNFRTTTVSSLEIVDELPSEVYRSLVNQEKLFEFLPREGDDEAQDTNQGEFDVDFIDYKIEELESKHTDLFLQTLLSEVHLLRNLTRIRFKANQLMQEQGYNILYLTLGMVEWEENDPGSIGMTNPRSSKDQRLRSPLIMVPVELVRKNIRSRFKLQKTDEDPFINPALVYKFKSSFDLKIPDLKDPHEVEPKDYFNEVSEVIKLFADWRVTTQIYLGLFSFAKFLMFKDLETHESLFGQNRIISNLAGISLDGEEPLGPTVSADEIDTKVDPTDIFQVLDADATQQEAIEAAKSGRNVVIEGPPGTGKSQTIANLISEFLAAQKTVLFVSEKMAALDVVYNRLNQNGLGDYCLELHSKKASKRHVVEQLSKAATAEHPGVPSFEDEIIELNQSKALLEEYLTKLHQPLKPFGKSLFWVISRLNAASHNPLYELPFEKVEDFTFERHSDIVSKLEKVQKWFVEIGDPSLHPFFGTDPQSTSDLAKERLKTGINFLLDALKSLEEKVGSLVDASLVRFDSLKDVQDYKTFLESILQWKNERSRLIEVFPHTVLDLDLRSFHEEMKKSYDDLSRFFKLGYYKLFSRIKSHSYKRFFLFFKLKTQVRFLAGHKQLDQKLQTVPLEFVKTLHPFMQRSGAHQFESKEDERMDKVLDFVFKSDVFVNELTNTIGAIQSELNQFDKRYDELNEHLKVTNEQAYGTGLSKVSFDRLKTRCADWLNSLNLLTDWSRYVEAADQCKELGLSSFVERIISENQFQRLVSAYERSFYARFFEYRSEKEGWIKRLDRHVLDEAVAQFTRLDVFLLKLAQVRTLVRLNEAKPDTYWEASKSSKLGYLQKQLRLKRGHHPIRVIFSNVGELVQKLCPCFLMSPISVAQFIDPTRINFDVVIFDEASQISPEDAVGSIIRGRQLVVAGDPKQLPPTSFFQSETFVSATEEDDSIHSTPDLESVLDECLASGMVQRTLKWHYRSRDESLIHFSNQEYYGRNLYTFPSPLRVAARLGVSFVHVEDGLYERGGKGVNRVEARVVAEAVMEHFRKHPEKSLGVGTFNQNQQIAILDEIDNLRMKNSELEEHFSESSEHFFVKNLETIQGDERDVIFISVGFGKDQNGRISMNFGALNKTGGERRLNVLVTRAKEKVVVFSSILPHQIDLSRTPAKGVKDFRHYLEFARGRTVDENAREDKTFGFGEDVTFETSVLKDLQKEGLKGVVQHGYGRIKIDNALIDPQDEGQFLVALECDGKSYLSSATVRDRNRLRKQVLEGLGWQYHRIWAVDWIMNKDREIEKIKTILTGKCSRESGTEQDPPAVRTSQSQERRRSNSLIQIESYKEFQAGDYPEYGVYEDLEWNSGRGLMDTILKVLTVEAPIHVTELARRVNQCHGGERVGKKIQRMIDHVVMQMHVNKLIHSSDDFVYNSGGTCNKVRSRQSAGPAKIELICSQEIQNAVDFVLEKEYSVRPDDLVLQVISLFGLRATENQKEKATAAIKDTLRLAKYRFEENRVKLKENHV